MDDVAPEHVLDLADWRRRVAELYAEVRRSSPEEGHARWRAGRDELFARHPQSPYPSGRRPASLPVAAYDPAWRFEVVLEAAEPRSAEIAHSASGTTGVQRVGVVELPLPDGPAPLSVWWLDQYGGGLFLPFRDASNGATTYGAGRYILDTAKGADLGTGVEGRLIIDLNFAYHPSCAYDPRWSCPLAPPDEGLPVVVPVGELLPP